MFELYQSEKTEKFHFRLKAKNGEIILTGQGYKGKKSAENGIASVAKNAASADNFEVKEAADGRQYFVLKASNGQVIGQSQMYKSASGLKNGIASVQKNADSEVKDLTA
ncbi:MAG: YegP family protein [Verrucomicrobiales bacterium]